MNSTKNDSIELPITFSSLWPGVVPEICSWVQSPEELRLISSDVGDRLDPTMLNKWRSQSIDSIVLRDMKQPAALCMLSTYDNMPRGFVELCHFIVSPNYRRKYFGATLVYFAIVLADIRGYDGMLSRITQDNSAAVALANYTYWTGVVDQEHSLLRGFRWFSHALREDNYSSYKPID